MEPSCGKIVAMKKLSGGLHGLTIKLVFTSSAIIPPPRRKRHQIPEPRRLAVHALQLLSPLPLLPLTTLAI